MTRSVVYSTGLIALLAATGMTIASIFVPTWITWTANASNGDQFRKTVGLHRSCSSTDPICHTFPQYSDCHGEDRYFCSMWRSVGFMMSFAAVLELATVVAYTVVLIGGKQKRESGWKVLVFLLGVVGLLQCASMAIVAYLFDYDQRFFDGWKLDTAWVLCTVSWCIAILSAALISLSAFVFPQEGGYELIPSERHGG